MELPWAMGDMNSQCFLKNSCDFTTQQFEMWFTIGHDDRTTFCQQCSSRNGLWRRDWLLTRKETVCSTANNSVDCCKHPLKMSGLCAEHIADADSMKSKKQKNLGISGETGMTAKIQPSRLQHVLHPTRAAHWKKDTPVFVKRCGRERQGLLVACMTNTWRIQSTLWMCNHHYCKLRAKMLC